MQHPNATSEENTHCVFLTMSLGNLLNDAMAHLPGELWGVLITFMDTFDRQLLRRAGGGHPFLHLVPERRPLVKGSTPEDLQRCCVFDWTRGVKDVGALDGAEKSPRYRAISVNGHRLISINGQPLDDGPGNFQLLVHYTQNSKLLYGQSSDGLRWALVACEQDGADEYENIAVDFLDEDIDIAGTLVEVIFSMF